MTDVAPAPAARSNLTLRVISALALAAIVLPATWWGGWPFAAVWLAAAALVAREFLTIAGARAYLPFLVSLVGIFLTGLWAQDMAETSARVGPGAPHALLALLPVAAGLLAAMTAGPGLRRWAFLAAPYATVIAVLPILMRGEAMGGIALILWLFATVWFTDIAAYFAGRFFGGPKLWPAVSPKKTWSGAIGGALAGVIGGVAIVLAFGKPPFFAAWSIFGIASYTLLASAASQLGDLAESAMKRAFDVKDSGSLIPGHGGLMDRLDGFWAACALVAATLLIFGAP